MHKTCSICKLSKYISNFHKNRSGTKSSCKSCVRHADRVWGLKKKYNISLDEYNELLMKQLGNCGICARSQNEFKVAFAVDHCHATNNVRGLLCIQCNTSLGNFRDSVYILESAIAYLNKYKDIS
jgi:hypothetical protein